MFEEVIAFWFEETDQSLWWQKDFAFDELIRERFSALHAKAIKGELFSWRSHALGALAEVIVLDQFSRNMFRDKPESFLYDSMALVLAQEAVAKGLDKSLNDVQRSFLYMPYMHSESLPIHWEAEILFKKLGVASSIEFEKKHKDIIERYGRYPHRNNILARTSTPEEEVFLQGPNSSF